MESNEFFLVEGAMSTRLSADWEYDLPGYDARADRVECRVNPTHRALTCGAFEKLHSARVSAEVRHNKKDEPLIWIIPSPLCLVHKHFAKELRARRYSGFRLRPATIRFRDGYLSQDYKRLVVTGWGGVASPDSGVRLVNCCSGCNRRDYSPLEDPSRLVDTRQWAGQDFFVVWPLLNYIVATRRVIDCFLSAKVRNCRLLSLDEPPLPEDLFRWKDGFIANGLSSCFPRDIAAKYRRLPEVT